MFTFPDLLMCMLIVNVQPNSCQKSGFLKFEGFLSVLMYLSCQLICSMNSRYRFVLELQALLTCFQVLPYMCYNDNQARESREMDRDAVESDLTFAGFATLLYAALLSSYV